MGPIQNRSAGPLALASLAILLTACDQATTAVPVPVDGLGASSQLSALEAGIHPVLVFSEWGPADEAPATGTVTIGLHLAVVETELEGGIGSYQGVIRYDADRLELLGAAPGAEFLGAWNETETGNIRFAGVALEGVGAEAVLQLQFELKAPLRTRDFFLELEEIAAAADFRILDDLVVQSPIPVAIRGEYPLEDPQG